MDNETQIKKTPLEVWLFAREVNLPLLAANCKHSRQWLWSARRAAHVDKESRSAILGALEEMNIPATELEVFGDET